MNKKLYMVSVKSKTKNIRITKKQFLDNVIKGLEYMGYKNVRQKFLKNKKFETKNFTYYLQGENYVIN